MEKKKRKNNQDDHKVAPFHVQADAVQNLQVLGVDDAGTGILAWLQLHCGDIPAAGACGVVVERGAVSVLGVFRVDDGGALVADGPLPWLQVHLGFVAPPGAVSHRHHRLAEGCGRRNGDAKHLVTVVLVGVILDLGVTPESNEETDQWLEWSWSTGGSVAKTTRVKRMRTKPHDDASGAQAPLLDFLLRFGVDLDAFSVEHGVHAGLWVCSCGVQQQVGQLCRRNRSYNVVKSQQGQFKTLHYPHV